jgi:lysozyme family protein
MADFITAVTITLENEGGYADRSATTGEVVNRGITLAFLRNIGVLTSTGPATVADKAFIQNMSVGMALDLYLEYFWNNLGLDACENQQEGNAIFDLEVNTGSRAVPLVQKALNAVLPMGALTVDGILGPQTMRALNTVQPKPFLSALHDWSMAYYNSTPPAADRAEWIARSAKMTGQQA